MKLLFRIISGSRTGDEFRVLPGVTLGRSKANINLKDPRASAQHAKVEDSPTGPVLVDLNSSNGIIFYDQSVDRLPLSPGTKFTLGETIIEVVEDDGLSVEAPREKTSADTWQTSLQRNLKEVARNLENHPRLPQVVTPTIRLEFVQGSQAGTRWLVGYGPRQVGANTTEFSILEPDAPSVCFQIDAAETGVCWSTFHPDVVLLNNRSISSEILKDGDLITIYKTKIRVGFSL